MCGQNSDCGEQPFVWVSSPVAIGLTRPLVVEIIRVNPPDMVEVSSLRRSRRIPLASRLPDPEPLIECRERCVVDMPAYDFDVLLLRRSPSVPARAILGAVAELNDHPRGRGCAENCMEGAQRAFRIFA